MSLCSNDYQSIFVQLSTFLHQAKGLWQFKPFHHLEFPWQQQPLLDALGILEEPQIHELMRDKKACYELFEAKLPVDLGFLRRLEEFESSLVDLPDKIHVPSCLSQGIPGRKLEQLNALASGAQLLKEDYKLDSCSSVLEWCAGKGYLGRVMNNALGIKVRSLEFNAELCEKGAEFAKAHSLSQSFHCEDVLALGQASCANYMSDKPLAVALHACGDLHDSLIRKADDCGALILVPCCYHLTASSSYQPLSELAVHHDLFLQKSDLSCVVQGVFTGPKSQLSINKQRLIFQFVFDFIQRDFRAVDEYMPIKKAPDSVFREGLEAYLEWAFIAKTISGSLQVVLSSRSVKSLEWYLEKAEERYLLVRQMELVQSLFRRPLELWLLLDKMLYLQELGFTVELQKLCQPSITPRNLVICAYR